MKIKNKELVLSLMIAGLMSTGCKLTDTPLTSKDQNLNGGKSAITIVGKESESFGAKLAKAGTCDRGVFSIDVVNNAGGIGDIEDKYFAWGKGYFTSKSWSHEKINPFHPIGIERGEKTFPDEKTRKASKLPFSQDLGKITAEFYNGKELSSNTIAEGNIGDQADALKLEKISASEDAEQTYTLTMSRGDKKHNKNLFMGNLPKEVIAAKGYSDDVTKSLAVVGSREAALKFGTSKFTHFGFGKDALGVGVYMVPPALEGAKAFTGKMNVAHEAPIALTINSRGKDLPAGAKAAYLEVSLFGVKKSDLLAGSYYVADTGQTSLSIPTKGMKDGAYWMVVKRGYLYSSDVQDEGKGKFCVWAGSAVTSRVDIAEAKK